MIYVTAPSREAALELAEEILMTLNIKSRKWSYYCHTYNHFARQGVVDPDFDNDNHFPPTAETLDHYQPHHRVLSDELIR